MSSIYYIYLYIWGSPGRRPSPQAATEEEYCHEEEDCHEEEGYCHEEEGSEEEKEHEEGQCIPKCLLYIGAYIGITNHWGFWMNVSAVLNMSCDLS